jgi:hypothetical protein
MDIKRKYMIFEPGKKLFLDISSTSIDTLVRSLDQCVETRSVEVFSLLSHRTSVSTSSSTKYLPPKCFFLVENF